MESHAIYPNAHITSRRSKNTVTLRKCCASKYDVYFDTKLPEMHVSCYGSEVLFYLVYEVEPEHLFVVMLLVLFIA